MTAHLIGLVLACANHPEDGDPCAHYATVGAAPYGLCVRRHARGQSDPRRAATLCATLVPDESDACRMDWVLGALGGTATTQTLLEVCATAEDCAFYIVDNRPERDVFVQAAQCAAHAGRYQRDCLGHAWERWAEGRPTADELERVASRTADGGVDAGRHLGIALAAHGAACPDAPEGVARGCRTTRTPEGPRGRHPEETR